MVGLLCFGCATPASGPGPAAASVAAPAATPAETKKLLDEAEQQLLGLNIESATGRLDEAKKQIAALGTQAEAAALQARHAELSAKVPEAKKALAKKKAIAAKATVSEDRSNHSAAMTEALANKAPAAAFDKARGTASKLEASLAEVQPLEAEDPEYAKELTEIRAELDKSKADLDAQWLKVGVGLQKTAIDAAANAANGAMRPATQNSAKAADFEKAEAANLALGGELEKGSSLEAKDAKYAEYAKGKRAQLEGFQKSLADAKKKAEVRLQTESMAQAKTGLEQALTALKTDPSEANFAAAQTAYDKIVAGLEAGKAYESTDAGYAKVSTGARILSERYPKEIEAQRAFAKIVAQKANVEAARTAAKDAVSPLQANSESGAFSAAEQAIAKLKKAVEDGKALEAGDKGYAAYAAGANKEVESHQATIERLRQQAIIGKEREQLSAVATNVEVRLTALSASPEAKQLEEAEKAVADLEAALKQGEALAASDKTYAAQRAALEKKLATQKAVLEKKKLEQKIAEHRAQVESEQAKTEAALAALAGQTEQAPYQKAEDQISAFAKVLSAGDELGAADAKYGRALKVLSDGLPAKRMQMRKTRIEATNQVVLERLKALEGPAQPAAFEAAGASVRDLNLVIEGAKTLSTTDKGYLGMIAGFEKQAAAHQAAIEKRRTGLGVEQHKAKVEVAAQTLSERMKALEGEPEAAAFGAADSALSELRAALESIDDAAAADKGHQAYLAQTKKTADVSAAQLAKRRVEVAVAQHKKKKDAAVATLAERLKALDGAPEPAAFGQAESAVADLEKVVGGAPELAASDAKYQVELKAAQAKAGPARAQIERRRGEVEVGAHRAQVDAADQAVTERLKVGKLDAAGLKAANEAVDALEQAIAAGQSAGTKDAKHGAYLSALTRKIGSYRSGLERAKTERAIEAHQAELNAQVGRVDAALAALNGQLDQALYQKAEDQISKLAQVISAGEELGAEDAKYAKTLKAVSDGIPAKRMQMRKIRVEAHQAQVAERIKALEGTPDEAAFSSAEEAVKDLGLVIDGAKNLSGATPAYNGMLAGAEKQVAGYQAAIEKRRVGLAVAKHRATVEAAAQALVERMKALEGEPEAAAFDAATAAAAELKGVAESADAVAESDAGYKNYLAGAKKNAETQTALVEKKRAEAAVRAHRSALLAAQSAVGERLKALAGAPDDAAFAAAESAVGALEKVIGGGEDAAQSDAKYKAELAGAKGKLASYRGQIERRRDEVEVVVHRQTVDAAASAAAERTQGTLDAAGIKAAAAAVDGLEQAIQSGEGAAAKDKKHAAYLAGLSKKVAGYRAALERSENGLKVAAHREKVATQQAKTEAALSALNGQLEQPLYQKAEDEISRLAAVVSEGSELEDAKYAKELQAITAGIPAKRMGMRKTRIAANEAVVEAKLAALSGAPAESAFGEAEEAVKDLSQVIDGARNLSGADKAYEQTLAAAEKKATGYQAAIEKRKVSLAVEKHKATVEAAKQTLVARLGALDAESGASAFDAAENAIAEVKGVAESVDGVAESDKAYASYLDKTIKEADAKLAEVDKRRGAALVSAHRQQLTAAQAAVAERLKALAGEPDEPAFAAAEGAVAELEKVIDGGQDASEKDGKYKTELAASKGKIGGYRAQIERRKDEVEVAEHRAQVDEVAATANEKLSGKLDAAAIADAEKAVEALESAIAEGDEAAAKDKKHAAYLAGLQKKVQSQKATLARAKVAQGVETHRAKVEAAKAQLDARLASLEGQLEQGPYQQAEEAVSELSKVISAGSELEDAKYQKELNAVSASLPAKRQQMRKIRIEANEQQVQNRLQALDAKADEAAFSAAEEAVKDLGLVIEGAGQLSNPSKDYQSMLGGAQKKVAGYQAAIDKRRVGLAVEKHRATVEAANEKLAERMKALGEAPDADAFDAAVLAIDEVKGVAESVDGVAEGDKGYAAYLAKTKKDAEAKRAEIGRRRAQAVVKAHQAELGAAQAVVSERLKALAGEPDDAAFAAAEEAVNGLESVLKTGKAASEADAKYGKTLAGLEGKVPGYRSQIERRREDSAVLKQRAVVEAKEAAVETRLESLDGDAAIAEAERAIEALEGAIGEAESLPSKDKKALAFVAVAKKKLPQHRAAIEKQRFAKQVAAQTAELATATQEVEAKIAALEGKTEHGLYQAAEDSVSGLMKVIEASGEVAERSGELKKRLAAANARVPKLRMGIRRQRIKATEAEVEARFETLAGKPEEDDFRAAESSVQDFGRTVEAARALPTGDKADQKYLAEAQKQVGKYEKRIEGRRAQIAVEAHRAGLEAAQRSVDEKLAALKSKPGPDDFAAAEEAVSQLESAVDTGADAAEKDPKYKQRLQGINKKAKEYRATIEERRFDAEVAGHREKVEASVAKVSTVLEALGPKSDGSAFGLAEEAIGELEGVLNEGEPFGQQNKAYEKKLAAEQKKLPAYRAKIEKRKVQAELAEHVERLDAAESALSENLKALGPDAKEDAFTEAAAAVETLEREIEAGAPLAKVDKQHQKRLALARKSLPKRRAAIATAQAAQALQAQRSTVEEAGADAQKRIDALDGPVTPAAIKAAEDAIGSLQEAVDAGKPLGKKNKKHGAYLASVQKKIGVYRKTIGRKAVAGEVAAHEARLEAAEGEVKSRLDGVKGQLEFSLYQAVEESISDLRKVIDDGGELGSQDSDYAKRLKSSEAGLDGYRILMRRRWIEAADAEAEEKMKALEGKPEDADFAAAEAAVRDLENTTDSGKRLKIKNKEYQALLASADKSVKRYRSVIGKRKSATEFGDVRRELETAVTDAAGKMSELSQGPSEETSNGAADALDALDRALEAAAPAGESDGAFRKKLAGLHKKLKADRSKLEKLKKLAESKPQLDRLAEAEGGLDEKLTALNAEASEGNISEAQDAVIELEAAMGELKSGKEGKELKKRLLKDKKKITLARATLKKRKGSGELASQKAEVEKASAEAKVAVAELGSDADQDAVDRAQQSVDGLFSAIEAAKDAAKSNKKLQKYLVVASRTGKKLKGQLKAKSKLLAKRAAPAAEDEPADDYPARLGRALAEARAELKALKSKPKDEVALTSARAAVDALESLVEESKDTKPKKAVAKKLAAAKKLLKTGKKKVAVKETAVARGEESSGEDPTRQVASAWASFSKQMKALKKKKPTVDDIDSCLQAASDVEAALDEGSSSSAGSSAKFKKYSSGIKKKLKKAKAKLNKARRTARPSVG